MPCRCDRSAIDVFLSQEDMVEHSYRISPSDRAGAYPSSTGANWTYPCTWHCMVVTVTYDPLDTRRLGYQGCIRFGYTMACVVDYEVPIGSQAPPPKRKSEGKLCGVRIQQATSVESDPTQDEKAIAGAERAKRQVEEGGLS
ncbi:hypothetical protein IAQ61_005919 [Plenodomus lingam]|uniref:uncharacterized protein n=1 Tax=Leptosphaeria maculans TaxID=5022 RepID=UPI00332FA1D1|nr:hypothetical protein IAQ61_005919 [Plenodomus lingam]